MARFTLSNWKVHWRQVSALILEYHLPISFQGWLSCALINLAIEVKHRCQAGTSQSWTSRRELQETEASPRDVQLCS